MKFKEILYREFIRCIPYEECAAKKFHKYLKEHPELECMLTLKKMKKIIMVMEEE